MTEETPEIVVTGNGLGRDPNELSIIVDGVEIQGWVDVEVTLRAEAFPNSFTVGATVHDASAKLPAIAGAPCTVLIGDDVVVTGYIDRDVPTVAAGEHRIELMGRGKTQDLVDCSAEWPIGQRTDVDALEIAQTLVQPYAIAAVLGEGAAAGESVPQWMLNYGETAAEIIQRVARNAGLLAYEDARGRLVLAAAGSKEAASGAVYGRNVEACRVENSMDGRFSQIVCCGLSMETLGDLGGDTFYHTESDPNVPRHRLKYVVVENVAEDPRAFTVQKARWDMARAAGRGTLVHVTVDAWRDSAGALWAPNTMVPVEVPGNRAGAKLCLSQVTFRRNDQTGTTAELVLLPREAFVPEPIVLTPVNTADF